MAASSVAAKLKLEAEHTKLKQESPASDALNDDQCGRVTVWCTTRLIALGSIAFDCVVMSLTIVGDQLFVGDVGGNISIFAHHASREGFKAEIQARVEQSVRVESSIASSFLARRQKLQVKIQPVSLGFSGMHFTHCKACRRQAARTHRFAHSDTCMRRVTGLLCVADVQERQCYLPNAARKHG